MIVIIDLGCGQIQIGTEGLWANTNRYKRDYNFIYACACVHIGT